jgi:hypothetical protein
VSSVEQDDSRGELNSREKISGKFVVAGGNATELLEFVEEAFDEVALAVEREIACARYLAIGLGRDHRGDPPLGEFVDKRIGVESLVADEGARIGMFEQWLPTNQIVGLAWREHQVDGIAQSVDERVDFGGQSPAGSPDGLRAVFFRAPALCWWARTMVASIIMYSLS